VLGRALSLGSGVDALQPLITTAASAIRAMTARCGVDPATGSRHLRAQSRVVSADGMCRP
jgi:hypothetical protein